MTAKDPIDELEAAGGLGGTATRPAAQASLPGTEEDPCVTIDQYGRVIPRWLHVCEVGTDVFALATVAVHSIHRLPGLTATETKLLEDAADLVAKSVMREIGRRAWEETYESAVEAYAGMMQSARDRTVQECADEQAAQRAAATDEEEGEEWES